MKPQPYLANIGACQEAREWVGQKSLRESWATCPNAHWMLWLLAKRAPLTQRQAVTLACAFARRVLHLVPAGEGRPRLAVAAAAAWLADPTEANRRTAAAAARAAAYAADAARGADAARANRRTAAAARAGADAAYAVYAVNAAAYAPAYVAAYAAAYVAANAAYAAADDAAECAAQADIIRQHITYEMIRRSK